MRAIITGTGHYAPETRLTNSDLEKIVDTNDEWITSRTGIKERRILDKGVGVSFMATKAAEMALAQANTSPSELDLILVGTVTPDLPIPSAAALVQRDLKADNCWGYDVNGGCTGFLYALVTAAQFIQNGTHKKIMVIGADKMSAILDYEDRNTCVIFGDGAGAALLEPSDDDGLGIFDFDLGLDGEGSRFLSMEGGGSQHPASPETVANKMHYIYQDGKVVFKRAIKEMSASSVKVMERNGVTGEDLKLFVPHQANMRIIDAVSKRMNIGLDKVAKKKKKYGNTTAGTIPIAMSEANIDKRMSKGDWVLMSAFGAGFTWGTVLMKWAVN